MEHREKNELATSRKNSLTKNNFIGVRQRPSGKWVAEIKNSSHKIRMWLGTFNTAEAAARAYDEAAFLLRGKNTRTNFLSPFPTSALSIRIRTLLNQRIASKQNPAIPSKLPPNGDTSMTCDAYKLVLTTSSSRWSYIVGLTRMDQSPSAELSVEIDHRIRPPEKETVVSFPLATHNQESGQKQILPSFDLDHSDAFWDYPTLYELFCQFN